MKIRVLIILLTVLVFSCKEKGVVFNESYSFENKVWSKNDTLIFPFSIPDTIKQYNIYINLRTSDSYYWSNIYFFTELSFPNHQIRRDTLEFTLTDNSGKWLGKNSGTIIDNQLPLYLNSRFPISGDYSLTVFQAMREPELYEILDFGIKIKEVIEFN